MKKPKILVVGSFMMDLIAETSRFPLAGETVEGLKFNSAPGGKGANQAVQCARLGADVTMVGCVGADVFGQVLLEEVKKAGVDVQHVRVVKDEASGIGHITLERTENGVQNRITICPGANRCVAQEDIQWLEKGIQAFDMVMLQFEIPMEINVAVAAMASKYGVPVMVNPAPAAPLPEELLRYACYLSPNETEAAALAGQSLDMSADTSEEELKKIAEYFKTMGVRNLIITLGERGSVCFSGDEEIRIARVKMPIVMDPTAAGDSFVASFCTAASTGMTPKQALGFASHAAAITVSRMGAMPSLPTIHEVRELLKERNFCEISQECLSVLSENKEDVLYATTKK